MEDVILLLFLCVFLPSSLDQCFHFPYILLLIINMKDTSLSSLLGSGAWPTTGCISISRSSPTLWLKLVMDDRRSTPRLHPTVPSLTHPSRPNLVTYPWANNPDRLRFVTNGRVSLNAVVLCMYLFVNQYGVKTFAIGGTKGELLSKFEHVFFFFFPIFYSCQVFFLLRCFHD